MSNSVFPYYILCIFVRMASTETPLVSIVIPAYNVETTVIETLESVVAQTYDNIETIVIDDGSTDNTLEIVKEFVKGKPSIQVYAKENEGLAATRNYGFQFVKGEYLLFLDADDLIDPSFVELCVAIFNAQPDVDIITTQVRLFERENRVYAHQVYSPEALLRENCFVITSMIKSEAFRDIGMFDTSLKFHEDWDMWIRMTEKYNHVVRINKPLFWYRKRYSQDSLCDRNEREDISDEAHLSIYIKYYHRFSIHGYSIKSLFKAVETEGVYQKKYKNVWYRKFFYKFFKKEKSRKS